MFYVWSGPIPTRCNSEASTCFVKSCTKVKAVEAAGSLVANYDVIFYRKSTTKQGLIYFYIVQINTQQYCALKMFRF